MASWKTVCIVKMMLLWNFIKSSYDSICSKCHNFYYYMKDYIYGHHDTWIFIPGHTAPISSSNLYNAAHINWIYDNFDKSLSLAAPDNVTLTKCKFSWLSAKILVFKSETNGYEYNIDEFIENFSLKTANDIVPSLYMIFMCWCAHYKHWFSPDEHIEFHIIDDMGEEICLNLDEHNESLCIRKNKITIVIHSDDTSSAQPVNKVVEPPNEETPLIEENKSKDD